MRKCRSSTRDEKLSAAHVKFFDLQTLRLSW